MTKKVALVTGANKGIGREVARSLAVKGLTVLLGARDAARGAEAVKLLASEGADVRLLPLDVTSADSIAKAVESVTREPGRLDYLVNNAGVGSMVSTDFAEIFSTNVFGLQAATRAFLPLLRASKGRIVNVSSTLGSLDQISTPGSPFGDFSVAVPAYAASKTAVNALTAVYARELAKDGITVNSVCPGYCSTDSTRNTGPRSAADGARSIVTRLLAEDGHTGGFFDEAGRVAW